jgi:alanine dehydrogenase
MLIGVPKEVKTHEFRAGLTAMSVKELVRSGHAVLVQAGAGDGTGGVERARRLHDTSGRGRDPEPALRAT